jgi:hypothetical protein
MVPMLECNENTECMLDNLPPEFGPFREPFQTIYPAPAPTNQEEAQVSIDKAMEYWREVGWPEACRPEGDSFTRGLD